MMRTWKPTDADVLRARALAAVILNVREFKGGEAEGGAGASDARRTEPRTAASAAADLIRSAFSVIAGLWDRRLLTPGSDAGNHDRMVHAAKL